MTSDSTATREAADADKVDAALELLSKGAFAQAEPLLLEVIANTPADYRHSLEDGEGISIKFWDMGAFLHFVSFMKSEGTEKNIVWIKNAYPRAYYFLGFSCVAQKDCERAIEYLDKGAALEPGNPNFATEKAQALVQLGRKQEALVLFEQVSEIGPYINAHNLAVAQRGRGFVLIELGKLDEAEKAFRYSLELEPGNELAQGELEYIAHLRQGGAATQGQVVAPSGPNILTCQVCGKEFTTGSEASQENLPKSICNRCAGSGSGSKKWWQVWK